MNVDLLFSYMVECVRCFLASWVVGLVAICAVVFTSAGPQEERQPHP